MDVLKWAKGPKTLAVLAVLACVTALVPAAPALANHGTCELDLTPETATNQLGATHVVTATLRPAGTDVNTTTGTSPTCTTRGSGSIDVLFEVTSTNTAATYNPTNVDRQDSRLQPDLGCTIPSNASSCSVSYTRTAGGGSDSILGWFSDDDTTNDTVTKTWTAPQASYLNVTPDSDANPPHTAHTFTATVRDSAGNPVAGINVDFEVVSGPNDDLNSTRADLECATGSAGTCTVDYTDATNDPAPPGNVDTVCAWLDPENDDVFAPFGSDARDGGDCDQEAVDETEDSAVAGADAFGNDFTDKMSKTWTPPSLTFTPAGDTASVGTCNAFTITIRDGGERGISGVNLDVEQVHQAATNGVAGDEPTVSFCTPAEGPNPSTVDESRGDLRENPDNLGTAGGETTGRTDANGQMTIGVSVAPAGSGDGTGTVTVSAWQESSNDNDDADAAETRGSATKTWVAAEARTVDCEPETSILEVGGTASIGCLVRDRFGAPLANHAVVFTSSGPGYLTTATRAVTDANGRVTVGAGSFQTGTQTVVATLESDLLGAEPTEVDQCDRSVGDPFDAPAGECADGITVSWTLPATGTPVPAICQTTPGAFIGTDGDDVIVGTTTSDVICGRAGNDSLRGMGGNDLLLAGAGTDQVSGAGGRDRIVGGDDADALFGGDSGDLVSGGDGNDSLRGGTGEDRLRGNAGSDRLGGGAGGDALNGGPGRDSCTGGPGRDRMTSC